MKQFLITLILIIAWAHIGAFAQSWLPSDKCADSWSSKNESGQFNDEIDKNHSTYMKRTKRSACHKEWTVLVYMAADNDLSPYALWDLHEMETQIKGQKNLGATSGDVDVVVELDTYRRSGISRYHMFQGQAAYDEDLSIEDFRTRDESSISSPLIQVLPEVGAGSLRDQTKRFEQFLQWGIRKFPAKRYMVVIWGHGEGYLGTHYEGRLRRENVAQRIDARYLRLPEIEIMNGISAPTLYPIDKVTGGVAFDYSELSFMDIPSLASVFKRVKDDTLEGKNLEILSFDACLMQSLEVATELSPSIDFLVGSNQIQNYLGLPYRSLLDLLNSKPQTPTNLLTRDIVEVTRKSFLLNGYQAQIDSSASETFSVSALSLIALRQELLPALDDLSRALLNYLKEDEMRAFEMAFIFQNSPSIEGETKDLGQFFGILEMLLWQEAQNGGLTKSGLALKGEVAAAASSLARSIEAYAYGERYIQRQFRAEDNWLLGQFRGLSVWMPRSRVAFEHRFSEFSESALFERPWGGWMRAVLASGALF
jgi:hypothetical protein